MSGSSSTCSIVFPPMQQTGSTTVNQFNILAILLKWQYHFVSDYNFPNDIANVNLILDQYQLSV